MRRPERREKALVDFTPKPDPGQTPTLVRLFQGDRRRRPLPPGRTAGPRDARPRTLSAGTFRSPTRVHRATRGSQVSREVEGRGGQTIEVADFKLARGREVVLRVVDADGRPLAGARIDVRDPNRMFNTPPAGPTPRADARSSGSRPTRAQSSTSSMPTDHSGRRSKFPMPASAGAKGGNSRFGSNRCSRSRAACWTRMASHRAVPSFIFTETSIIPARAGARSACRSTTLNKIERRRHLHVRSTDRRRNLQHPGRGQRLPERHQQPRDGQARPAGSPR